MDTSLLKNLTQLDLPGATVFHNQDRTYAKCFIGEGESLKIKGVSTEDRWRPNALQQAIKWAIAQGVAVPLETQVQLGLREPEPIPEPDTEVEASEP